MATPSARPRRKTSTEKSKTGSRSRPQAKTGVNLLRRLAKEFVVEESEEDYAGWDIQLEEVFPEPSSTADFLGRRGHFTYKFQIKSPKLGSQAHKRRSVGIELQHWERACSFTTASSAFGAGQRLGPPSDRRPARGDAHQLTLVGCALGRSPSGLM